MAEITSTQNGDWSNSSTWQGGSVPGIGDTAVIQHIVEIDGNISVGTSPVGSSLPSNAVIKVDPGATLKWKDNPTADWTLTVYGGIYIKGDSSGQGVFQVGSESVPIPSNRTATIHLPADTAATGRWYIQNDGGIIRICGANAYHMASASSQRTKLVGSVTAGAGVTFQTDDNVDWETGDTIWVGIGASYTSTPSGSAEEIQVTKVNTNTYTADFTYDHVAGDFLVHSERNVLIKGGDTTTHPLSLRNYEYRETGVTDHYPVCDIQWAKFQYAGYYSSAETAIYYEVFPTLTDTTSIPSDYLRLKNLVFVNPGNRGVAIALKTRVDFTDTSVFIDEIHGFGMFGMLDLDIYSQLEIGHVTSLDTGLSGVGGIGIYTDSIGNLGVTSYWFNGESNRAAKAVDGFLRKLENFEIYFGANNMVNLGNGDPANQNTHEMVIQNGYIYHANGNGLTLDGGVGISGILRSVDCSGNKDAAMTFSEAGEVYVTDCTFDRNNLSKSASCIQLLSGTGHIEFSECDFGMRSRNWERNCTVGNDTANRTASRIIFNKCRFYVPYSDQGAEGPTPDPSELRYFACRKEMFWAAWVAENGDWRERVKVASNFSLEFVDCSVYNYLGNNVWPTYYPSQVAVVSGGGEVRLEDTNIIDNTFARKILPFHTVEPCMATYNVPISFPVFAGQAVTIRLSLKRNIAGSSSAEEDNKINGIAPGIHLRGPGMQADAYMTSIGSWQELTVSDTAVRDGSIAFYVSAGVNEHTRLSKADELDTEVFYSYHNDDQAYSPPPQWLDWGGHPNPDFADYDEMKAYVEGAGGDDIFAVVVYADGLEVEVV